MYYSDELVEEVRTRNDIVDVVGQYVRLTKKGSTYFGLCPFHNEKTGSFSVAPNKQMYYCFGCHAGGNVITFLMEYENITFPEAFYMATLGGGAFFGNAGSFEDGYDFDAVVLDDTALVHPQELSLPERLERAVYLGLDAHGILAKYAAGTQIML